MFSRGDKWGILQLMRRGQSGLSGLTVWIAAVTGLTSCSGQAIPPSMSPSEREESEVREVVFWDLLKNVRPGEVCFITFGVKDGVWVDPPKAFLGQLDIRKVILRK